MAFRIILIENESEISVKLNNLIVNRNGDDIWIPMDDISMIVLDNLQVSLTTRMLCALAQENIGVVLCNQEHLPIGFYSSYDNHSRISKNIGYQIEKDKLFYDELWQAIVKAKIENQSMVIKKLDKKEQVYENIQKFKAEVLAGDTTNREAHAAKIYFNELMGTSFSRGNDELLINSGLDYGYAIIRSYLARVCVGYGINSQLGIHHRNEYNRFNFIDDIIEPIRPIVDLYIYILLDGEEYFKVEHRRKIVNILNHKIIYKKKNMYLCNALEDYVESIAAYFAGKEVVIEYPRVIDYVGEEDEI